MMRHDDDVLKRVVDDFNTPLYLYDAASIVEQYRRATAAFPGVRVLYSAKANPNLGVAKLLCSLGAGIEVASSGEIRLCERAGFQGSEAIFVGPGKTCAEIESAIRKGFQSIAAESMGELRSIQSVAASLATRTRVMLRLNLATGIDSAVEQMIGGPSRFGFDEELLPDLIDLAAFPNIVFCGVHCYGGSQILDASAIARHIQLTSDAFAHLAGYFGEDFRVLDYGGGFGIPYAGDEHALSLEVVAAAMRRSRSWLEERTRRTIVPLIELGRYLVAESGTYLTRVVDVKRSRGRVFVICDGGMHQFLRPAFMHVRHGVSIVARQPCHGEPEELTICGRLCTPLDVLVSSALLPVPAVGDIVAVHNAGAYGYTMSPLLFLGHAAPREILLCKEDAIALESPILDPGPLTAADARHLDNFVQRIASSVRQ
ncbi:MAG: hypothetical protein ABSD48_18195 [Armatimonadota bacterium]|jgi:diaminopimelate decarboxylase